MHLRFTRWGSGRHHSSGIWSIMISTFVRIKALLSGVRVIPWIELALMEFDKQSNRPSMIHWTPEMIPWSLLSADDWSVWPCWQSEPSSWFSSFPWTPRKYNFRYRPSSLIGPTNMPNIFHYPLTLFEKPFRKINKITLASDQYGRRAQRTTVPTFLMRKNMFNMKQMGQTCAAFQRLPPPLSPMHNVQFVKYIFPRNRTSWDIS